MTKNEAMQMALYALITAELDGNCEYGATNALRTALAQPEPEPVELHQIYRCKIKSLKQINKEIPRERQGWWADISAGQKLLLRHAVQSDIDRCTLNNAHSKDPADYMCETFTNGSLVHKNAIEYMNAEQNVFASTAPPQRKPLTDEEIMDRWITVMQNTKGTALPIPEFARAIEAAHGIKD